MKKLLVFLMFVIVFFTVNANAQTQHVLRNQFEQNVLVEIPGSGVREYLNAASSGSNTSKHLLFGTTVLMKITVDYQRPVEMVVRLEKEYIDINQELLNKGDTSTTVFVASESNFPVHSEKSEEDNDLKKVLFVNATKYKMVGKTGAVKGLTLMPGDTVNKAIIRVNQALRYNILEDSYMDNNSTVVEEAVAKRLLSMHNSSAKIKWINPGIYEENFKVYITESGEKDKIGALLILQFIVDENTNHIIIDSSEVNRNLPHGEASRRDVVNKSNKNVQLTIGGTQKVIPSKRGRRFSKMSLEERLKNGYYYITVSLITNKAIQRDLLLLVNEEQRHFIINQDDLNSVIRSDYQGQGQGL